MLVALSAGAAELWRWKDADGVMHYSDRPVPGAERITVQSTQRSSGEFTPRPAAPVEAPPEVRYTRCIVSSPQNDETFNNVDSVDAVVTVEPALQPDHSVQVFLNGAVYTGWPPASIAHTLTNLFRGSYTLSVRVLDANGRPACTGSIVNFHVRQASLLQPGRRPAGG